MKAITALCAHMLVDARSLDVQSPVARYGPAFAHWSIELADLASIAAGSRGVDRCCGGGPSMRVLVRLLEVASVVGVDATPAQIERGRRECERAGPSASTSCWPTRRPSAAASGSEPGTTTQHQRLKHRGDGRPRGDMSKAKIVCTIGPASRSPEILERLIRAGMDVARLNFSHGTQAEHLEVMIAVRRIAERLGRAVAILQDLAGLKIRVGEIASGAVTLEAGAPFVLTTRRILGSSHEVSVPYSRLTEDLKAGDTVLLSDGDLELSVTGITAEDVQCRVVTGGTLASRKGVDLPSGSITAPTFTDKDRDDLAFGLRHEVDYVALSFVRTAADVLAAREMTRQDRAATVPLIAKIETQIALAHIDDIIDSVDGIMVARGDLGLAIPLATVPRVQKTLVRKANRTGKPVITATHMLRSMQDRPRPTRAEVTDVANAVLDGTDAIMLSEETAIGLFPVEAVTMMAAIAADAESDFPYDTWMSRFETNVPLPDAVARAVCSLAADADATAIVACTQSGVTARRLARYRPQAQILAATPSAETYRQLALVWGVTPLSNPSQSTVDELVDGALATALAAGHVHHGDTVVVMADEPFGRSTNLIKVETL
jgi:pyruvate kinase